MNHLKMSIILSSLLCILLITGCGQEKDSSVSTAGANSETNDNTSYPEKEITMFVPFSAGGTNDTAARILAEFMTKYLDESVVIENKPGSGGAVQTTEFARVEADGYALQFSAEDPFATLPLLNDNLKYTLDDFDFLIAPTRSSMAIVVHNNSPYETIDDLVKDAIENNKLISFSHAGVGSVPHLSGEVAFSEMGINTQQIPFDGGGQALNALLSEDVDVLVSPEATIQSQLEEGNVRVLAVTSEERSPFVDAPTLKELGYEVETNPLMSVYTPAGTPEPIKKTLVELFQKIMEDPEYEKAVNNLNLTVDGRSGDEVVQYYKNVSSVYEKVMDEIE